MMMVVVVVVVVSLALIFHSPFLSQIHYLLGDCCGGINSATQQPKFSYSKCSVYVNPQLAPHVVHLSITNPPPTIFTIIAMATATTFPNTVIGYGDNFPKAPHHRAASCEAPGSCDCSKAPHPHNLFGALVGGPDAQDVYSDDCQDYTRNEVATDYNAGFTSAVAGLKHLSVLGRLNDLPAKNANRALVDDENADATTTNATSNEVEAEAEAEAATGSNSKSLRGGDKRWLEKPHNPKAYIDTSWLGSSEK